MTLTKRLKRAIEYGLVSVLLTLAARLPEWSGRPLFCWLGGILPHLFRKDMERAMANLAIAFPGAPQFLRKAMARAMFGWLARNCYEFARLSLMDREEILSKVERIDGLEHFLAAFARGRGVISITGHIGCWELMAAYMRARGYPVAVVARRLWIDRLDRRIVAMRDTFWVETIRRDENRRRMVDVLRSGGVLGMLMDIRSRRKDIAIPFFGKPAFTPSGVARLAWMTGAMIVPMAIYQQRDGQHVIRVLPPIDPLRPRGRRVEVLEELTRACSCAVEELIRHDPLQWLWFQDRWGGVGKVEMGYA